MPNGNWSAASNVRTRGDKNGTAYMVDHDDETQVKVRIRNDGTVHVRVYGGNYAVAKMYQGGEESQHGLSTAFDLWNIDVGSDIED